MRINAVIAEQAQALKGMADILGKLDTGDLIRAKVLEITTGELLLKLSDGTLFRAAASDLDTTPGETLELIVKGRSGETLVMETVKKNLSTAKSPEDEITKLLGNIGVKPEKQAVALAAEAKSAGINVSKELVNNAVKLLNSFKSLTPEKAVFLSSKNIEAGSQVVQNAIRILEGSLQLGQQLEALDSLLSKLNENNSIEAGTKNSETAEMIKTETAVTNSDNNRKETNEANKPQILNNFEFNTKNDEINTGITNQKPSEKKALTEKLPDTVSNGNSAKTLVNSSADFTGTDGLFDRSITGKHDSEIIVFPKTIDDGSNETKELENPEIREMVKGMKQALKDLFITVNSEKLASEMEIKELFKEIHDKLEITRQLIETVNTPDRAEISAKLQEVEEGIRLLNQFSSNNVYVQLPMNVNGYSTTAELYIYKKEKGKKRIDPQNAIVLIALDTQNLGRIESVIDVKGKNVSLNLRAEEQSVINFFKENYKLLYSGLLEKGYRLADVKYRLIEERINPSNAVRLAVKDLNSGYTSVDLKI